MGSGGFVGERLIEQEGESTENFVDVGCWGSTAGFVGRDGVELTLALLLTFDAIGVSFSFLLLQQIPETHQLLKWEGLIMAHVFRGSNHGWLGSVETQHIVEECGLKRRLTSWLWERVGETE